MLTPDLTLPHLLLYSSIIGIGATLVMDTWALLLKFCFNIPSLNYAFVGRWLGHMRHGSFMHNNIGAAASTRAETLIGWIFHYLTGVFFAGVLLIIWGEGWLQNPTISPALTLGVGTVLFPFLIMQPSFGLGIGAAKTPAPNIARLRSLMAHTSFGIGLYVSGWLVAI